MGRIVTLVRLSPGRVVRRGGKRFPRGAGWFWVSTLTERLCFTYQCWWGVQLVWRGSSYAGDFPSPNTPGLRERVDMKRKTVSSGGADERHLVPMESEVLRDHLAIIEHLAVVKYDDGEPREPGYLTIRTQGRAWVADVKDPDSGCSFRAVASTIDELLETVQELLATEDAPWEADKWLQNAAKRRGKK